MKTELIPGKKARRASFLEKKSGLIMKAYELATFCAIDVGLIFGPDDDDDGDTHTWPHDPAEVHLILSRFRVKQKVGMEEEKSLPARARVLEAKIAKVRASIEILKKTIENVRLAQDQPMPPICVSPTAAHNLGAPRDSMYPLLYPMLGFGSCDPEALLDQVMNGRSLGSSKGYQYDYFSLSPLVGDEMMDGGTVGSDGTVDDEFFGSSSGFFSE